MKSAIIMITKIEQLWEGSVGMKMVIIILIIISIIIINR